MARIRRRAAPNGAAQAAQAAQDWLPLQDLTPDGLLLRRDGAVVGGLRIRPFSLALRSRRERDAVVAAFAAALNGLQSPYQIVTLPRPIDLDTYLLALSAQRAAAQGRRRQVLGDYGAWVSRLAQQGAATERRAALLVTRTGPEAAAELPPLLRGLEADVARIRGLDAHPLTEADWRELLFLLWHGDRAAVEPIPTGAPQWAPVFHPNAEGETP